MDQQFKEWPKHRSPRSDIYIRPGRLAAGDGLRGTRRCGRGFQSRQLFDDGSRDVSQWRLHPNITPSFTRQLVRVELYDPIGNLRVTEATTDNSGNFTATVDLRYEPSLEADRKKWKKAKAMLKGTYRAQAQVVVSTEVSSAESAMVFIQR